MGSPGLAKCLDVGGDETADVTGNHMNVRLTTCSDGLNLNFRVVMGQIKVPTLDKCLIAESAEANANVVLGECTNDFKWFLSSRGYVQLDAEGDLCMDVQAQDKDDGSRENWEEIKEHENVNVILYNCH